MFKILLLSLLFSLAVFGETEKTPHRLEVLFLGDDGHHNPIERYRILKQFLGPQGFNLTFEEDLSQITHKNLSHYDALIVYANHEQETVPKDLLPWIKDGGALVALHSACGCFHPSEDWFDLVGGRFASHEGGVFSPRTIADDHPITRELPVLESWDETYQHTDLTEDRFVLQVRDPMNKGETEPEPWTWVRTEGKGRVSYTASGHDLRCWKEPAYLTLVQRAILWTIGDQKASLFSQLNLPPLETEIPDLDNRTHPDIPMMELQKPLSPAASAAHTQVPVGTRLQLFASEPMIMNPIAIDWDTQGRAWVVESFGYPNDVPEEPGSGSDTIKILTDTDHDGAADEVTVFAKGLRHCTATVFTGKGLIATDGRDFVYLEDTDGDDQADVRNVLATGLIMNDTHASTSNLFYGLDNWIYATVGYSGVDMQISGKRKKFSKAVFRFRPDLSELELIQTTTNNTWGLGFTEEGDITGSTANNNPSWMVSTPAKAYLGSNIEQSKTPRIDMSRSRAQKDGPRILPMYTNTLDVTQVDQIEGYTAVAGHQFYTDRIMEEVVSPNNVFICEPTGHIVATGEVVPDGSILKTILRGNNIFASSDAWAAPVACRVGPDGAVWIADWYNPIIQHNVVFRYYNPARGYDQAHSPFHTGEKKGPGKGNAYRTPLRDRKHGRIWRVVPTDTPLRESMVLNEESPEAVLAELSSPSQLIRLQAQRLLVESQNKSIVPELEKLLSKSEEAPLPAIHALWTLEGLRQLDAIVPSLSSSNALLRRHAMTALGGQNSALQAALPEAISSTQDQRELLHVLNTAALAPASPEIAQALWERLKEEKTFDHSLKESARLALRKQRLSLLQSGLDISPKQPKNWQENEVIETIKLVSSGKHRETLAQWADKAPSGLQTHIKRVLAGPKEIAPMTLKAPQRLLAGRDAYLKACIECHQADGKGVEGTFPPLVDSEWIQGNSDLLLRILLGGLSGPIEVNGEKYDGVMPGHSHVSDKEIAEIANFVRFAFGKIEENPINPRRVKRLRPEIESRKYVPWTAKELKANLKK
ncbi:MAG: PVC-type heme-binding CxxCH protein [Roseibacillus sp.]